MGANLRKILEQRTNARIGVPPPEPSGPTLLDPTGMGSFKNYLVAMAKRTEGIAFDNLVVLTEIRDLLKSGLAAETPPATPRDPTEKP